MKTTRILLVIAILQALTILTLWKGDVMSSPAKAAVPDSGVGDIKNVLSELTKTNEKLDAILKYMESGKLQVQVAPADKNK